MPVQAPAFVTFGQLRQEVRRFNGEKFEEFHGQTSGMGRP
jgi:hypothetical protein